MMPAAHPRSHRRAMRAQLGVAAVELAIVLGFTMVLLPAVALFGRVFYQYSIMKGATRDAAAYVASVSPTALRDETERARVFAVAQRIVTDAALHSGMMEATAVGAALVTCGGRACQTTAPEHLDVSVTFTLDSDIFTYYTGIWLDENTRGWEVIATSTIPFSK